MKTISVKCEACGSEFDVPTTMAGLRMTCNCGRSMMVPGDSGGAAAVESGPSATQANGPSAAPTGAASASPAKKPSYVVLPKLPEDGWYFTLMGLRVGPVPLEEVRRRLRTGELERDAKVYNAAVKEWRPAPEVPGLWRPPAAEIPADMWHISVQGKNYGPYAASRMWDMIEQGKVTASSKIWSRSLGAWKRAGDVPEFAVAWGGGETAVGEGAAAAAEVAAPAQAEAEAAPGTADEASRRAEAAFNGGRYLAARDLYRQASELGAQVSAERFSEIEDKVSALYENAEALLRRLSDSAAAWDFDEAECAFTALTESEVYQHDDALRGRAEELNSGIGAVREEAEKQRQEAAGLCDAAEQSLAAWDVPGALQAVARLEQLEVAKRAHEFTTRAAQIKGKTAAAEQTLRAQRRGVEGLLRSVEENLLHWHLENARRQLQEAEQEVICKVDGELRRLAEKLRAQLDALQQQAKEERDAVLRQLADGEQLLAAWDLPAAFDVLREIAAAEATTRDKELGTRMADLEKRARSAERELAAERPKVSRLIEEARADIPAWELEAARHRLQEAAQSKVHAADAAVRHQVDMLLAELEAAEDGMRRQRQDVELLSEEVEQKLAGWDMPAAFEALTKLEGLEILGKDAALALRVAALKDKAETGERKLVEQRQSVAELIEDAKRNMADQDYEGARAQLDQASQMEICTVDVRLRTRVESLSSEVDAVVAELKAQRERADELLAKGEERLAARDTFGVFEALEELGDLGVTSASRELAAKVTDLRKRTESTERNLRVQRQEVTDLVEAAKGKLKTCNLTLARRWLEEAEGKEISNLDEGLCAQVKELRSELETAEADIAGKRKEAAAMLAEADKRLEGRDIQAAGELLAKVEALGVSKWDEALDRKAADLKQRMTRAEESLSAEREEVPALLEEAADRIAEWDLRAARRRIEEAAHKEICQVDPEMAQRVERARQELHAAEEEVEKSRTQVSRLLAEAMTKLAGWDFASASAAVAKLEEFEMVQRDSALRARVTEVKDRINNEEQQFNAQRQALCELLEAANAEIAAWDFEAARTHVEEAEQRSICKLDSALRRQVRTIRSALEASERESRAQREEAPKLLAELERKLAGRDFAGAAEALMSLQKLEVVKHDQKLAARLSQQEERLLASQEQFGVQRAEVVALLESAKAVAAKGDLEAASRQLKEAADKEVCKLDGKLRQQVEAARAALEAAEKGAKRRQEEADKLLKEAEAKLGARDLAAASAALGALEALGVAAAGEAFAPKVAELQERARKLEAELAERHRGVADLLQQAKTKTAESDFETARYLLEQAARDKLCESDAEIRKQVEGARAELQAAEGKADKEREEASSLLGEAEKKLKAQDVAGAFEMLSKVEALGVVSRDAGTLARFSELLAQAEKAEHEITDQRHVLAELLERARAEAAEADFHGARQHVERAARSGLYEADEEFRQQVDAARSELEAAEQRAQQELKVVGDAIEQSAAKLESGDPLAAAKLLQSLATVDVCHRDQEVRRRIRDLKNKIIQGIEEQRQKGKAKAVIAAQYSRKLSERFAGTETIMLDNLDALEGAIEGIAEVAFVQQAAPAKGDGPPELPKVAARAARKQTDIPTLSGSAVKAGKGGEGLPPALPAAAKKKAGTAAGKTAARKESWYYFKDGQRQGPMPIEGLQKMCKSGGLGARDKVWSARTVKWVEAASVRELAPYFRAQGGGGRR